MKKQLLATMVVAGCLLGLQASAFAQSGPTSFAFSGSETVQDNAPPYWSGSPSYWDYVAPNAAQPFDQGQAKLVHRHGVRR